MKIISGFLFISFFALQGCRCSYDITLEVSSTAPGATNVNIEYSIDGADGKKNGVNLTLEKWEKNGEVNDWSYCSDDPETEIDESQYCEAVEYPIFLDATNRSGSTIDLTLKIYVDDKCVKSATRNVGNNGTVSIRYSLYGSSN